ncbi:MAG: MOP flippase family protein [Acidobacteriota bacterium]|nr:MOP flippase family protein [Acidobacteriota bacterium]
MSLKSRAVSGMKWTTASSIVAAVNDSPRLIVLAWLLMPDDFGLMAMVYVVIGFAQMYNDLGISLALIHHRDVTHEELSSLYWLNIFSGIAIFAIIWFISPLVPLVFHDTRVIPLVRAVGLIFLIAPVTSQFEILLQKELAFKSLAIRDVCGSIANTIAAVSCAFAGFGVWSLVVGQITNTFVRGVLIAPIGFHKFRPSIRFHFPECRRFLSFGLFQLGERSANYLGQRLDQILIGAMLGPRSLGFYTFAYNLTVQPMYRLSPIFGRVAFPVLAKVQDDSARLKKGYLKLVNLVATCNAPLLIGLAVLAPVAVPIIFGSKWSESIILVQVLSFVVMLRSVIYNPIGCLQNAKGRADLGFWWNVVLLACSAPVIYIGARIGDALGVVIALLIQQIVLAFPMYLFMIRPLLERCGYEYASAILKPILTAATMGILVAALPLLIGSMHSMMQIVTQLVFGFSIYIALMKLFQREALAEFRSIIFPHSMLRADHPE